MGAVIRKILIANRGEIACRIITTCRELGIVSVAVYSDADANALHVERADEAVHIGASPPSQSYLNLDALIAAAQRVGADAIHPGYGFLSENADFARQVTAAGLIFIGPSADVIERMGKKREAKRWLKDVPVVPGYMGDEQSDEHLISEAAAIGYPVMVKASAGGGGKGMRQVSQPDDMPAALESARREALQAFGDDTLILEKVLIKPHHVEVQIFGDQHGTIIALGERECSIQRRHQKIIEETPSSALTPELREAMFAAAVSVGKQLGYVGAGTVEFLLDADQHFYFMEMNTRLQVEHPVTEMVTGFDLVRWQIEVAEGKPLPPFTNPYGHAVEVRVYAEDPHNDFLPTTGHILRWREPQTHHLAESKRVWAWSKVIVDSGVRSGDEVTIYYDPLLAKVITHGDTREEALRRLDYALSKLQLLGVRNNIDFLRRVLLHPDHRTGDISTTFLDDHPDLFSAPELPPVALIAAALARQPGAGHWRNNPNRPIQQTFQYGKDRHVVNVTIREKMTYSIQIGTATYAAQLVSVQDGDMALVIDGYRQQVTALEDRQNRWWTHSQFGTFVLDWISPLPEIKSQAEAQGSLRAPMPGQVIAVQVTMGQVVKKGETLLILEAMKMEHRIKAPHDGTVAAIFFAVGQTASADALLLEIAPNEPE